MKTLMTTALFLISINALAYDMEDVQRILNQQEAEQKKQLLIQAKQLAKNKAQEQSYDTQNQGQSTKTIAIQRVYDTQTGRSYKEVVRSEDQQTNIITTQPHYNPQPLPYTQPMYYPEQLYYPPIGPYPQQGFNPQQGYNSSSGPNPQQGYDKQNQ